MKKFIKLSATIIAGVMVVSMIAACSSDEDSGSKKNKDKTEKTTVEETEKETEKETTKETAKETTKKTEATTEESFEDQPLDEFYGGYSLDEFYGIWMYDDNPDQLVCVYNDGQWVCIDSELSLICDGNYYYDEANCSLELMDINGDYYTIVAFLEDSYYLTDSFGSSLSPYFDLGDSLAIREDHPIIGGSCSPDFGFPYFWLDSESVLYFWNGFYDEYVGENGGATMYYYDTDGDVWYFDGDTENFIGSGDDYYIDNGMLIESDDSGFEPEEGAPTEPYYYYDEDGDVWYWNGEYDEFIGSGDDYCIEDGELYEINDADY